ncbi:membrane anchor subunit of succinate dehydrogenase, Sdh4, partial [Spiromyces aspiralis]
RPVWFKATQASKLFGDEVPNPATVPKHEPKKLSGSYHWVYERTLTVLLVPLVGTAAFYGAHPINDLMLGIAVPLHVHMGMESVLIDYFHSRRWPRFGPSLTWLLRLTTLLALYGCWKINTEDVGVTEYTKRLWNANKRKKSADEN